MLYQVNSGVALCSHSADGSDGRYLLVASSHANIYNFNRAYGVSVRCFKDL
ncbi:hypothetical protein CRYPA_1889 [uncultured Candidatus Thioglobus sp.]|nr:hypothetical protein CRYPA_1889 [uncultured Candidatus Thioglobus sp.]